MRGLLLLPGMGPTKDSRYLVNEALCRRRSRRVTIQNRLVGDILAIQIASVLRILVDFIAREIDTRKKPFVPRVGQELRTGNFGGVGL